MLLTCVASMWHSHGNYCTPWLWMAMLIEQDMMALATTSRANSRMRSLNSA